MQEISKKVDKSWEGIVLWEDFSSVILVLYTRAFKDMACEAVSSGSQGWKFGGGASGNNFNCCDS